MPSPERMRKLRMICNVAMSDQWKVMVERWTRDWEDAHHELATCDAADTATVIRLQERIKLIESLIRTVEADAAEYERERRRAEHD